MVSEKIDTLKLIGIISQIDAIGQMNQSFKLSIQMNPLIYKIVFIVVDVHTQQKIYTFECIIIEIWLDIVYIVK